MHVGSHLSVPGCIVHIPIRRSPSPRPLRYQCLIVLARRSPEDSAPSLSLAGHIARSVPPISSARLALSPIMHVNWVPDAFLDASCTSRSAAVLDLFHGGCTRMRPKTRPKSFTGNSCTCGPFLPTSGHAFGGLPSHPVGLMAQEVILEGCAAVSLSWIDASIRGKLDCWEPVDVHLGGSPSCLMTLMV
jgi:hypothetical protein